MSRIESFIKDRPVYTVQQDATVLEVAQFMAQKNIGAVAVLDARRLVGIFSERDVITRVIAKQKSPDAVRVAEVMTRELVIAEASESEESCLRKMKAASCRHLPIVSGEELLGIVSLRDLLQVELTDRDETLGYLNDYLFHVPPDVDQRYK